MKKKSPKGIKGFHAWQMRWFELTTLKLAYWEVSMDGAVDEKGGLPLTDIVDVRKHAKDDENFNPRVKLFGQLSGILNEDLFSSGTKFGLKFRGI